MYKGEEAKGLSFYNLLFESKEFNVELGKVALSAGRLEAELKIFLWKNGIKKNISRATLGQLIRIGKENKLLEKNLISALEHTCKQRNYLMHNIYALFIEIIDETILERGDLLDSDVLTYTERAWQLHDNLTGLADIISKNNKSERI